MQEGEPDTVALTASVGPLRVTVQGPLREATVLLQHLQLCDLGQVDSIVPSLPGASAAASGPSSSSAASTAVPVAQDPLPAPEAFPAVTRRQAEELFPPCPAAWLDRATQLGESNLTPSGRIRRAWRAGQWARLVLAGNYATPLPSENLRLASRFYPVVGGVGVRPCLYTSFRSCQAALGPISQSSAVLHGFPSELEAKIYVDAAGLVWPLGGQ